MDYKKSGVDIEAGDEAVRRIRDLAEATFTPNVLSNIGAFGGLFHLDSSKYQDPVLVASADGVGTKLRVALLANRYDTVGVDLVNHCVNDILVQGAEPLFFLDYLATGRLTPETTSTVVQGMAAACQDNRCVLLGGETAEMPGFYRDQDYDLAGFIVGVVERDRIINGKRITPGDKLIGLPSSGLHTNGFSLARQIVFDTLELTVASSVPELGRTIGEALLVPHRSYLKSLGPFFVRDVIKGLAHITGGGLTDNLPRILPDGTSAIVRRDAWTIPHIFRFLQEAGEVSESEMYRTFNMGIGMVAVCDEHSSEEVIAALHDEGETEAKIIGSIEAGNKKVVYR